MFNVVQSMKKCSSSDHFPTTRSLLRSFLNKSTTTFRHFAAVVIPVQVYEDKIEQSIPLSLAQVYKCIRINLVDCKAGP